MKVNKMLLATILSGLLLLLLIGWAFYQSLQMDPKRQAATESYPEKAVMEQARAMNTVRLDALAERGKVASGMSMSQVRLALGEPSRTEQKDVNGKQRTIWWYRGDGWLSAVFDANDILTELNYPQPNNEVKDVKEKSR